MTIWFDRESYQRLINGAFLDHHPWITLAAADPPPTPPTPDAPRLGFTRRYGVLICDLCQLAESFCKCGTTPATDDEGPTDGGDSSLVRRIRAQRGKAGQ